MPAFGVGGGENESLIEIVTTYRDEASAGMAATAKSATDMGAAIQSASGIAEISVEQFRALGGLEGLTTRAGAAGERLGLPADFGVVPPEAVQSAKAMTAAVTDLDVATQKTAHSTVTMMSLWRLRAVMGIVRQVDQLGTRLLATSKGWAEYAAQAEQAENVAANIAMTHGELSTIMREEEEATARMSEELGEGLLPAYKDSIELTTSLKQSVADLSDGWQDTIGVSTTMVGVFLKVSAGIAAAGVAAMTTQAIFRSLDAATLAQAASLGKYAVGLGAVAVITGSLFSLNARLESDFQEAADILGDVALRYDMSGAAMRRMARDYYESLNVIGQIIFVLKGDIDGFVERMISAGPKMGTVFEEAAKAVEAMVLPAAQAFQSFADTQEDIQNEMLTKRREYAKVMADIDKFGYSEQLAAQADALGAQIRQLELADMQAAEAHERQMGQIVLQTISAFERIGRITPGMALEASEAAMLQFGMVTPETIAAGEAFLKEQFPGMVGAGAAPPGTEIIEGTVIAAESQVVALEDNTTALVEVKHWLEALVTGDVPPSAYAGNWVLGPTIGDELRTQGVRSRP